MKLKKSLLLALAAVLLTGSGLVQRSLNRDRDVLGLTRVEPLENAPPVLAFTTVALGGFRGLISNILWIRMTELQDEDKFFEMAQLADWITKLEPHYVQVWLVQAWNMAYNVSVKSSDFADRWRWVQRGVELLRDDGIRYNPNEPLIYRELAWFFQHKMGQNLDDAHLYYKQQWLREMEQVFGKGTPNLDELIHPQTEDQKERAKLLRDKFKMDPEFMKEVDRLHGPLEWRLPESSAIYWASVGLKAAQENPSKVKPEDMINLRRVIYQSMQMAFQRGRLVSNPFFKGFEFGPNLDIIPKVNDAYLQAADEDKPNREYILRAHRNFLRDAVYFLYGHDRIADAAYWFKQLGTRYPDKIIIDGDTNSYPRNVTLGQYAFARVQEDVGECNSHDRVNSAVEALVVRAYTCLAEGQDERAKGYELLAGDVLASYAENTKMRPGPLIMRTLPEFKADVRDRLLDPAEGAPFELRAALRYKLGMGPEPPQPSPATNAPAEKLSSK
jgi:hypothetical protein